MENASKQEALAILKVTSKNPLNPSYNNYDFQKLLPDNQISIEHRHILDKGLRLNLGNIKS